MTTISRLLSDTDKAAAGTKQGKVDEVFTHFGVLWCQPCGEVDG